VSNLRRSLIRSVLATAAVVALVCASVPLSAQIFVHPRRPGQTNVRYNDFEWHWVEFLVGDAAEEGLQTQAGPRLHAISTARDSVSLLRWDWTQMGHVPFFAQTGTSGAPDTGPDAERRGEDDGPPTPTEAAPAAGLVIERARDIAGSTRLEREAAARAEVQARRIALSTQNRAREVAVRGQMRSAGGVRFYFYESERTVAERAIELVERSYEELVAAFGWAPPKTFPLFLYSTYHEFLQTNLFPVQEGVLGITSPRGLEVTLPFLGDPEQFRTVVKHELVHQFTVQKVRRLGGMAALNRLPLWLIEGMAEYYTRGFDAEAEVLVRDLIVHPDLFRGFVLQNFYDERQWDPFFTYKVGQARCAFLEEQYGRGTIQRILERSHQMVATDEREDTDTFPQLVERVTGDDRETITQRFLDWIRRRSYATYVQTEQSAADFKTLDTSEEYIQAMSASPDGELVMLRVARPAAGRYELRLISRRTPKESRAVAKDRRPGLESLSPLAGRNFDVGASSLAFAATTKARDVIYWQSLEYSAEKDETGTWQSDIDPGDRTKYELDSLGIEAIDALSISPDDPRRVAVTAVDSEGKKDLWLLSLLEDGSVDATRVTDDFHAERGVDWGPNLVVYTSDATAHGRFNLFGYTPDDSSGPRRITSEVRDHFDPFVASDGAIRFVSYDEFGGNIYRVTSTGIRRVTSTATALFDPTAGPSGDLWALHLHQGRREPVRLRTIDTRGRVDALPVGDVDEKPSRAITGDTKYRPYRLKNWRIGPTFAILGASAEGIVGQAFLTSYDQLRNHSVVAQLLALGEFDLVDASIFYANQEHRTIWGAGAFHELFFRADQTFEDRLFLSRERFYGGAGLLRYPLNRYWYVQGQLSVGGVSYGLSSVTEQELREDGLLDQWLAGHDGPRFQTEASLSIGYNTIRLQRGTGPIGGASALLEGVVDVQPFDETVFGTLRFDAEKYFQIYDRINFFIRGGAGRSIDGPLARQFFLSSFETLRGVRFGNPDYLLGRNFLFSTAELQFPLNWLVRITFVDVEGIVGVDFGAAGPTVEEVWDRRVLDFATGFNFGLGPLLFRLHFAKPFDIGAPVPNEGRWNTNFSLGYRYL
jgi:hypothetical protein